MSEMMAECTDAEMLSLYVAAIMDIVQTPVQSLLTDVTACSSPALRNCTDDLQPLLTVGMPQERTDIDQITTNSTQRTRKYLHDGQLIIRHNNRHYNAQGIQLQ